MDLPVSSVDRPTRRLRARPHAHFTAALLAFGVTAAPLAAQETETEEATTEPAQAAVDPWTASVEFAFTAASGNQNFNVLTSEIVLGHTSGDLYDAELRLQARYGSTEGEKLAKAYQGGIDIGLRPLGHWSPYIFSTAEHDESKLLDVRVNSGAGAKYRLARADGRGEAAVGLALLDSYEVLATQLDQTNHIARFRLGLDARQELREGVSVLHTTRFEPQADALDNYLLSVDTTMKVLLTGRVALSVSYEFDRDATPAVAENVEIEKDDHLLKAGVLVQL